MYNDMKKKTILGTKYGASMKKKPLPLQFARLIPLHCLNKTYAYKINLAKLVII